MLDLEVVRDLEALEEREEPFLDFAAREELLLLLDLFELERLRVDRLLEDRVVWAMVIASLGFLGFRASCAFSHRRSIWTYPLSSEFERPAA